MSEPGDMPVGNGTTKSFPRKRIFAAVMLVIVITGAVFLVLYIRYLGTHISTDDAFIDGRIHTIAPKISGTVRALHVVDNGMVKKGDLLVEIDPADYDVKVDEAMSAVAAEKGKYEEIRARIDAAKHRLTELGAARDAAAALLDLSESSLRQAELDLKRADDLFRQEVLSKERHERTVTARDVAIAQRKAVREQLAQAEKAIITQKSVIAQAEAALGGQAGEIRRKEALLASAKLQRAYTGIMAPADGYVTKRSVENGNQVREGQPLMAVVEPDDIWITANYKETQLKKIVPGRKVTFKIDMYPGDEFTGRVDSIMSGTGSAFSLFPPENATGQYVKVVQRIPVKIMIDKDSKTKRRFHVGMSVVPTVITE